MYTYVAHFFIGKPLMLDQTEVDYTNLQCANQGRLLTRRALLDANGHV